MTSSNDMRRGAAEENLLSSLAGIRRAVEESRAAEVSGLMSAAMSGITIMPGPVLRPTMIVPQETYDRLMAEIGKQEKNDG